jgi:hypothetical protein
MEKNRHILDNALEQLRSFSPEERTWESIKSEITFDALNNSLSKLSTFDPPESVWNTVSRELSKQEKISQLKQFTPDEKIWQDIEAGLDNLNKNSRKIRVIRLARIISAAAAILFLGYLVATSITFKKNLNYTEEIIELNPTNDWSEGDADISNVLNELCKTNPLACSSPGFKEKEKELDFLNEQKQEVIKRMTAWDKNEDLQLILTKIELEKNEIIKQMISTII